MATVESDSSFQCYLASVWFAGLPWKRKFLGGRVCVLDGVIAACRNAFVSAVAIARLDRELAILAIESGGIPSDQVDSVAEEAVSNLLARAGGNPTSFNDLFPEDFDPRARGDIPFSEAYPVAQLKVVGGLAFGLVQPDLAERLLRTEHDMIIGKAKREGRDVPSEFRTFQDWQGYYLKTARQWQSERGG